MKYYTRRGDDGTTGWLGKGRISKHDLRIHAVGALDETSAALGLARSNSLDPRCAELLLELQRDLYQLMADVSADPAQSPENRLDPARVQWLEQQIDALATEFPMPKEFIVPGDSVGGAAVALARTITRRAERFVAELREIGGLREGAAPQYLNRLSSLLFVLELMENKAAGSATTSARRTPKESRR